MVLLVFDFLLLWLFGTVPFLKWLLVPVFLAYMLEFKPVTNRFNADFKSIAKGKSFYPDSLMTARSVLEFRSLTREGVPPENPLELFLTDCINTNIL